jgi:hypothetical protein
LLKVVKQLDGTIAKVPSDFSQYDQFRKPLLMDPRVGITPATLTRICEQTDFASALDRSRLISAISGDSVRSRADRTELLIAMRNGIHDDESQVVLIDALLRLATK